MIFLYFTNVDFNPWVLYKEEEDTYNNNNIPAPVFLNDTYFNVIFYAVTKCEYKPIMSYSQNSALNVRGANARVSFRWFARNLSNDLRNRQFKRQLRGLQIFGENTPFSCNLLGCIPILRNFLEWNNKNNKLKHNFNYLLSFLTFKFAQYLTSFRSLVQPLSLHMRNSINHVFRWPI